MPPQLEPHAAGICLSVPLLQDAFGAGCTVRNQMPIVFGKRSKPEPDLAVVVGHARDFVHSGPPTSALVLMEISDSTLAIDRGIKAAIYAKNGILDYWILNLIDSQLEIHRRPIADTRVRYGFRFEEITILKAGQMAMPLARLDTQIKVADMLP